MTALAFATAYVLVGATASNAFALPEFSKGVGANVIIGSGGMKVIAGARTITCTEGIGEGEVKGAREITIQKLTYHGCSGEFCPSTIETNSLRGLLGETSEAKTGVGIALKAQAAEEPIAKFTCGGVLTVKVEGVVIGEIKPVKTESKSGVYNFTENGGKQAIQELTVGSKGEREKTTLKAFGNNAVLETTGEASYSKVVEVSGGVYLPTPEENYGGVNPASPQKTSCECGDPVNSSSGNLTEPQTDLSVGGRGPGLRLTRTYNAQLAAGATEAGAFGFGWTGPYSANLVVDEAAGMATVHQGNGSTVVFHSSAEKYIAGSWVEATLVKEGTGYVYTLPNQSKLEFNSSGQLTKEVDRDGNAITLAYNAEKRLETATDGDGRKLTFKYNAGGQVESVKDPMGHVVEYAYEAGNLTSVTIEKKARWKFEYNTSHEMTKRTDGRSDSTTTEYDSSHRAIKQVLAGHERKWKYGTNETTMTEPNGSETVEKFNEDGEPTEVTRAKGVSGVETTTKYEYNSAYQLTKLTDGNKHVTEYGYDSEGNKTSEKDSNGDEKKWTYNKTHDIETETTPEGETTTIKRNGKGEPEVIEQPIGAETQKIEYKYNEKGDLTEMIDPLGHATKYTYDAAGDRETETDAETNERKWKYNEDSQETEETDPRKFTTKTERDEQGRPIKITDPLGHTTELKYDGNGNVESQTDRNNHTIKYTYDEEDLRTKTEEPNKTIVETEYDSEGKMTAHKDGNGHTWKYKRNQLEQITEEEDPLEHKTKKEYDLAGNLKKTEDPEKHTVEYTYDESNRRKTIKYSTGKPSEVNYEYNKDSKVKKMTDETGTTEDTYDKPGRLIEYKNGAGKIVKYEYNLVNEPTKITYPNKEAVTRAYDKDNRLEKVTDWVKRETTISYNPDSQLATITMPAETKLKDVYSYNEADQVTEIKMLNTGETATSLIYTRDNDGQLKNTTNKGLPGPATIEDSYDENNRLTEDNKQAYGYDNANNPTKIEGTGTYSYNEADQLKEGPTAKYTYNEDGRRTETKPTTGPATTYGYDQVGNLTSVKRPKEGETSEINDSYTYDGNNLRQTQTINGTKTNLTWDTAEPLPLILSDESNSYIYGPDNLVLEQIGSGETIHFFHHDQQGSTRLLTNRKGEIEGAFTYNPDGSLNSSRGTFTATPLRYDDQYTSTDTGLIYLRARTYDPSTAQFLSVDPALEATGEPYAYSRNDPLNVDDPMGEQPGDDEPLSPHLFDPWILVAIYNNFDVLNVPLQYQPNMQAQIFALIQQTSPTWPPSLVPGCMIPPPINPSSRGVFGPTQGGFQGSFTVPGFQGNVTVGGIAFPSHLSHPHGHWFYEFYLRVLFEH
jgi:RHS repeat-associated protein